jgi:hypothetical protein
MIQASEFRYGNTVQVLNEATGMFILYSVEKIDTDGCYLSGFNHYPDFFKYTEISGIPLTEELLLKMGFVELQDRPPDDDNYLNDYPLEHIYDKGDYNVFFAKNDFWVAALRKDDKIWALVYENAGYDEHAHIYTQIPEIASVHVLQNIYYFLSGGQELTLS